MPKQILTIQYLRAISACMIVFYHAGARYGVNIHIGEGRVALFFIVSGFIFWWITTGRAANGGVFLQRRLARLVPLYWIITLITAALSLIGMSSHGPVTASHLIQSLLFLPHDGPIAGKPFPVFFPGWTLVYEMFFCLVFAALLAVREPRRIWVLSALLGGLALCGFVFRPTGQIAATYTNQILLEFLVGVWVARFYNTLTLPVFASLALLIAGVVLSFALVPFNDIGPELLCSGLPALMTIVGCLQLEKARRYDVKWLKLVGDSSYSIYIWHVLTIVLVERIVQKVMPLPLAATIVLEGLGAIAAGLVMYQLLEKPLTAHLMGLIDRKEAKRRQAAKTAQSAAAAA